MSKNILVISDIHLGQNLRATIDGEILKNIKEPRIDNGISTFLEYYTKNRINDKPWLLIINGDLIDFMSMAIYPNNNAILNEENIFGIDASCENTKIKLQIIMKFYPNIFNNLANFVLAGNRLNIVVGNHDAEFLYEELQSLFIAELYKISGAEDHNFVKRIKFHEWFYYDDLIYAEHGAQQEEYCATDYLLALHQDKVIPSVSHLGMKYFVNKINHYDPDVAEKWGFIEYIKWGYNSGIKKLTGSLYYYSMLVLKTFVLWNSLRKTDKKRKKIHTDKIKSMAKNKSIEKDLLRLYAIGRQPVGRHILKIVNTYFIDRMLLITSAIIGTTIFAHYLHSHWRFIGPIMFLVFAYLLNMVFNKIRFDAPSGVKLQNAARKIKNIIPAKIILMGHSHAPENVALGYTTYINTGSWIESGKLTYALIIDDEAELKYW